MKSYDRSIIQKFPGTIARNGNMMHDYYLGLCAKYSQKRQKRLAHINSSADAQQYIEEVRAKLAKCFGNLPEATPLRTRITGTVEHPELRIEKIVFESRPGLWVTSLFYIGKTPYHKRPGILFLHGHSEHGKIYPKYQEAAQRFALCGYAVLAIDPIGQGERSEWDGMSSTSQHSGIGRKMLLAGDFFGRYRLHDAISGLTCLLAREEVDSRHVGVTGTSGGGTLTTYLTAFDRRVTMSAPSSCLSTLLRNFENNIFSDAEQNPPGFLANGLDLGDYIIAGAPCPTIILAQDNDFNDWRGAETIFRESHRIYSLLGMKNNLELLIAHGNHGYSENHQLAAINFFDKCIGKDTLQNTLPSVKIFELEELHCVPGGNVIQAGSKRVTELVHEDNQLPRSSVAKSIKTLARLGVKVLKIKHTGFIPDYSCLRPVCLTKQKNLYFSRFGVKSENGITAILKMLSTTQTFRLSPFRNSMLYLGDIDTVEESFSNDFFQMPPEAYFALDVRMIGENRPLEIYPGLIPNVHEVESSLEGYGILLDRPNLGGQINDVLRTVNLLTANGVRKLHLVGCGRGALHAVLAALYLPCVHKLTLIALPHSWRESFVNDKPAPASTSYSAHGILNHFDLPELLHALKHQCKIIIKDKILC